MPLEHQEIREPFSGFRKTQVLERSSCEHVQWDVFRRIDQRCQFRPHIGRHVLQFQDVVSACHDPAPGQGDYESAEKTVRIVLDDQLCHIVVGFGEVSEVQRLASTEDRIDLLVLEVPDLLVVPLCDLLNGVPPVGDEFGVLPNAFLWCG